MPELVLVKLGGSLLTDKRCPETVRPGVIERLAAEAASARGDRALIIGHGSGSFGHMAAARAGMRGGGGVVTAAGAAAVQRAAATLHRLLVDALEDAGAAPFSLPPSAWMVAAAGRPEVVSIEPVERALELGMVPVVCGDVVVDRRLGATICSTESVFERLIDSLDRRCWQIRRMFWFGETAGIYDAAGVTVAEVDAANHRAVRDMIGTTAGTDVTGGMLLRLETARALARIGIDSWLVDGTVPGQLAAALAGEAVAGTRIVADRGRAV